MKIKDFFVVKNATKTSQLNDIMYKTTLKIFVDTIEEDKYGILIGEDIALYTGKDGTTDSKAESEALEDANQRLAKAKSIKKLKPINEPKHGPGRPKKAQEQIIKSESKRGPGRPKSSKTVKEPTKMEKSTKSIQDPIRKQIESEYMFHIPSFVIRSPGKFEGEMIYMPYYYGIYLEGGADDSGNAIKIEITQEDRKIFPELPKNKKYIKFVITDQGFVQQIK